MPSPKPYAAALVLIAVAFAAWPVAHAQDFRPGLWAVSAANLPKPQTFCVREEDLKKDGMAEMAKHGADCKKGDETVSGDTLTYWVTCTKPRPYAARVTVITRGPDQFAMHTDFSVDSPQGPVTRQSSMTYQRIGECN